MTSSVFFDCGGWKGTVAIAKTDANSCWFYLCANKQKFMLIFLQVRKLPYGHVCMLISYRLNKKALASE